MVTPSQKRVAVAQLVAEFVVSERRACLVVNQHRSTQRRCTTRSEEERALRPRIRALAVKYTRYGYRRIHVLLRREGWRVNAKRVWRLVIGIPGSEHLIKPLVHLQAATSCCSRVSMSAAVV